MNSQADTTSIQFHTIYECDGCGLCCRRLIIEADALDLLREPRINDMAPIIGRSMSLHILECSWMLNKSDGDGMECRFLSPENHCGIYATRPNTCVNFPAGGAKCQELRADAGLPPLVGVRREGIMAELSAAVLELEDE